MFVFYGVLYYLFFIVINERIMVKIIILKMRKLGFRLYDLFKKV